MPDLKFLANMNISPLTVEGLKQKGWGKEIIFTRERILIYFFEVPSVEEIVKSSSDPVSFHQRIEWLPGWVSNPQPTG